MDLPVAEVVQLLLLAQLILEVVVELILEHQDTLEALV